MEHNIYFSQKSGILTKDRPLVSYFMHSGKELFSAFGRAGVWFIQQVVRDHIYVFSAQRVTSNFNDFSAKLQIERNDNTANLHISAFKFDIDDFSPTSQKRCCRRAGSGSYPKPLTIMGNKALLDTIMSISPYNTKGEAKLQTNFS